MSLYAFDGTWNYRYGKPNQWAPDDTNVVKFFDAYLGEKSYFEGVGNEPGSNTIMEILGGAFGAGGRSIIRSAYMQLAKEVTEKGIPNDLDVIGYSRGAALAIHFLNLIREQGVPDLRTAYKKKIYKYVMRGGRRRRKQKTIIEYKNYHKVPKARFLGLWDVVTAFGIPIDIGPIPTGKINLGFKLTTPKNTYTCHAMALDENRSAFQVERMKGAQETWFRGVHSNVGGNYDGDEGLSDITLEWMLKKARSRGLSFDQASLGGLKPNPKGKVRKQNGGSASIRKVAHSDKVHVTVDKKVYPNLPWGQLRTDKT